MEMVLKVNFVTKTFKSAHNFVTCFHTDFFVKTSHIDQTLHMLIFLLHLTLIANLVPVL